MVRNGGKGFQVERATPFPIIISLKYPVSLPIAQTIFEGVLSEQHPLLFGYSPSFFVCHVIAFH